MCTKASRGDELALAASQFIGVQFKLLGRNPAQGLDCVGLLACSLEAIGRRPSIPRGYRLRISDPSPWLNCARESGLCEVTGQIEPGDILLLNSGPGQIHIVIAESANSAIHAHAGLRQVVRQPMPIADNQIAHWRLL